MSSGERVLTDEDIVLALVLRKDSAKGYESVIAAVLAKLQDYPHRQQAIENARRIEALVIGRLHDKISDTLADARQAGCGVDHLEGMKEVRYVLERVRAETTGEAGTQPGLASGVTEQGRRSTRQPGDLRPRQSSEPDVERLTREAHLYCPCRGGKHQDFCHGDMGWGGMSICKCNPVLRHADPPLNQACLWTGHAAIDRLVLAARLEQAEKWYMTAMVCSGVRTFTDWAAKEVNRLRSLGGVR